MNTKNNMLRILEWIGDITLIFLCVKAIFMLSKHQNVANSEGEYTLLFLIEIFILFFFYMFDLYKDKAIRREETVISVAMSSIATIVCTCLINVIFRINSLEAYLWIVLFAAILFSLEIWRLMISILFIRFKNKERILIVETVSSTSNLARKIKYSHTNVNSAWYYMIDDKAETEVEKLTENVVPQYDIIFISPDIEKSVIDKIFIKSLMLGKKVNILANVGDVATMNSSIRQFEDTPVIEKNGIMISKIEKFIKRGFDLCVSCIGLIVLSPFFLLSALIIKLDSPGPVIYKQERYTIRKRKFNIYKFRTMVVDAEKNGAVFAADKDPRITRSGVFLRKLRLDELPQIINIIKGDMSIVGPRPERPIFADEFCKKVNEYELRYLVKAGLTGYAQVYGKYNTKVEDKILMDLIYEVNYSLLLDFKLIILTVKTMFMSSATEGVNNNNDYLNSAEREGKRREFSLTIINSDQGSVSDKKSDNEDKKVSVLIPAYNCEKYIEKCLNSVFMQNYSNTEIIVVNDGSTDKTGEILKKYEDKITLLNTKNIGAAGARNLALDNSTGDYILFLDSDDYYEKNAINDLIEFQKDNKAEIIHFGYKLVYPDGKICFPDDSFRCDSVIKKEEFKKFIYPNFIKGINLNSVCCSMYSRSSIENVRFSENLKTAEDAFFNLRAFTNAKSVASLGIPYYCYFQHNNGLTGKGVGIIEKYKCNFRFSIEILHYLKKWNMNTIYWKTVTLLRPLSLTFDKILRKI